MRTGSRAASSDRRVRRARFALPLSGSCGLAAIRTCGKGPATNLGPFDRRVQSKMHFSKNGYPCLGTLRTAFPRMETHATQEPTDSRRGSRFSGPTTGRRRCLPTALASPSVPLTARHSPRGGRVASARPFPSSGISPSSGMLDAVIPEGSRLPSADPRERSPALVCPSRLASFLEAVQCQPTQVALLTCLGSP